jgi:predicted dehydrogenase
MVAVVVIGYGSVGQRHVRLLQDLGCQVGVVSRRLVDHAPRFTSIADALTALRPDYVVVANETSAHASTIIELLAAGFSGALLIEKPLGRISANELNGAFRLSAVAYNLRFHPMLAALAEEVSGERIIAMQIYCGQYLPDWRPHADYRQSYSADLARDGGVLRDLSHELDYLLLLGGAWRRVAALGGRFGPLDINSDDCWAMLLELARCPAATVQVNYLDRPGRRALVLHTASHTYGADFGRATLERDGQARKFKFERDDMYIAQHRAMLSGDGSRLCSLAEGEKLMQLIAAIERSARESQWVWA